MQVVQRREDVQNRLQQLSLSSSYDDSGKRGIGDGSLFMGRGAGDFYFQGRQKKVAPLENIFSKDFFSPIFARNAQKNGFHRLFICDEADILSPDVRHVVRPGLPIKR